MPFIPYSTLEKLASDISRIFSPLVLRRYIPDNIHLGSSGQFNCINGGTDILNELPELYLRFAALVLRFGEAPLKEAGIQISTRLGGMTLVNPREVQDVHRVRKLIADYLDGKLREKGKPLNIALLAPPGGGKSTIVKKLVKAITERANPDEKRLEMLTFNASQYETVDHFRTVWEEVRLASNLKPVLCFIDEFDVAHCKWMGHYLAPTNDGATFEPLERKFGPRVVFIFGGGVFESRVSLLANLDRYDKLPDFARRMDAYVDLGPVGYSWEHPQMCVLPANGGDLGHNPHLYHPSLSMPTMEEELSDARILLDYNQGSIVFQQRLVDLMWDDLTQQMRTRRYRELRRAGFNGRRFSSGSRPKIGSGIFNAFMHNLDKELFFALLKRALIYRFMISNRAASETPESGHLFSIEGADEWKEQKGWCWRDSWQESWIEEAVAWRLLHPLARFRAGVGSMDKFIEKIDFEQKDRFHLGLLPHFDEYRHLINYGPPPLEDPRIAENYMIKHSRYCECAIKIWPRRNVIDNAYQEVFDTGAPAICN